MQTDDAGWRTRLPAAVRPYFQAAPIAALFLGISSGAPYALIAATLTTRLAQDGIDKKSVTAFALAFLVYNLKWLWAWVLDSVRLPLIGRFGRRVSWLWLTGVMLVAAILNLAFVNPRDSLTATALASILVAFAGATFDVIIDAYRIELLKPEQLGVGAGMSQYGWRIGSVTAAALALVTANRFGWHVAYAICAFYALPAMIVGFIAGEPVRQQIVHLRKGFAAVVDSVWAPLSEFFSRKGAFLILVFILLHKIGDTLATLTFRLLFDELKYSNDEIAIYDIGFGFWAYLAGVFLGGIAYARLGMKRSVFFSLVIMAVSNLSFAWLASAGHSNWALAGAIGFENLASGIGGVTVVAYFAALCDLRFTAAQYALISAATSILGRILTGATAGFLIERFGYVNFYLFTTLLALPGIVLFWVLMRSGIVDESIGTAATLSVEKSRVNDP